MKGDFSRSTHDPRKHYAGVLMQQGRVQTDADWNEEDAIHRHRLRVETIDVVGRCGAPEHDAGFGIAVAGKSLTIGAGRYYVDGLLCVNETDALKYEAQPDLPGAQDWVDAAAKAKAAFAVAYLDVWERHITALDDPLLREPALGGPDTATRIKTVWQVRVLPIASVGDAAKLKDLKAKRAALVKKIADAKAAGAKAAEIAKLEADLAKLDAAIAALGAPTCDGPFKEWDDLVADPARTLNARTTPPAPAAGPCVVPPTAGYRRLENQLYRVEVHKPGALGTATFKWSRDNGTVVTSVEKISGKDVVVHDLGPDEALGFAAGQWVEIGDDRSELEGKPGQLVQIDAINASLRRITLKTAPTPLAAGADGVDKAMHPKLRRWDQSGASAGVDGVATAAPWLALEDGVEVQFGAGAFATGDYWLIPARTATGEIEWPPFATPNVAPIPQARRGIHHRFCRLALLALDVDAKGWVVIEDCRPLFPPLTEPCCDSKSMRVVATNWVNDDAFPLADLGKVGLRIRLDAAPDPASLTFDTVQVAVEMPAQTAQGTSSALFQRQYFHGDVSRDPADDHVIVWKAKAEAGADKSPTPLKAAAAKSGAKKQAAKAAVPGALRFTLIELPDIRIRVTVKGACIWNDRRGAQGRLRALDGQAFGVPALRADGKTPRIGLVFPTGHGAAGSDFESWFVIGARPKATALQVTTVRFLNPNDATSSAGDVSPPVPVGTKVQFKAGEIIRVVEITFNRAIDPATLGAQTTAAIFVDRLSSDTGGRQRLAVDLQPNQAVVRVVLRAPSTFEQGNYELTCVGTAVASLVAVGPSPILAADDHTALDGDYDDVAGGNLVLPFTAL